MVYTLTTFHSKGQIIYVVKVGVGIEDFEKGVEGML